MPSLSDLLNMGKQYVKDAMPGGLLNPEVTRQSILDGAALSTTAVPVLGDLLGLGADLNRYATDPESRTAGNFALSGLGMLPFVPAMTAWHGSPHKFDKFSLDKIGTGEGAQAYGHGLYLAESPEVAKTYQVSNSGKAEFNYNGKPITDELKKSAAWLIDHHGGDKKAAKQVYQGATGEKLAKLIDRLDPSKIEKGGGLYKTDIPDEAVARFLDWDKPLSQQAPEVNDALQLIERNKLKEIVKQKINSRAELVAKGGDTSRIDRQIEVMVEEINLKDIPFGGTGESYYKSLRNRLGDQNDASSYLKQQGISGIRYLDGGSRSAGQGSSNFVAFDPEMIRILERNGQPTGLEPWKPGEYSLGGLLGR